jgi:hypothetical protein
VSDFQKGKEGKPAAGAADQRLLYPKTSIADIADTPAEVENDRRDTRSGSWGDDQTGSPTLNKDLKLSKKLAR